MTLDRTKKYTVGTVPFKSIGTDYKSCWRGDLGDTVVYLTDDDLLRLNPVEVEEPLKWSFESDGDFPGRRYKQRPGDVCERQLAARGRQHEDRMTQEERIELLRQVSAVAPEEMGAVLIQSKKPNAQAVKFSKENGQATGILTLNGDAVFDAEAIIAMLDAIRKTGYRVRITQVKDGWDVELTTDKEGEWWAQFLPIGVFQDLSEGAARAFVEVFGEANSDGNRLKESK